jgi:3-deoxy-D-manno-octulosonic-acid transferase
MTSSLFLYNLVLLFGAVLLAPLWAFWLWRVPKTRAGLGQKLGLRPLPAAPSRRPVWVHTVSVGELIALRPLMNRLRADGHTLWLTTTTATAQRLAQKTFPDLPISYFPLDFLPVVRKALAHVNPCLTLVMETELWPNFLREAATYGPVLLVNGRLSDRSFKRYRLIRPLIADALSHFTELLMQSDADAERARQLGGQHVLNAGNIKYALPALPAPDPALAALLNIPPDSRVVTVASTHPGEEALLWPVYQALAKDCEQLFWIWAPRHPERGDELARWLTQQGATFSQRSQLTAPNPHRMVLLDSVGELLSVFQWSHGAIIGGSFVPWGGHNPLEPLRAGVPTVYGPHMHNFRQIVQTLSVEGLAEPVADTDALLPWLRQQLSQPSPDWQARVTAFWTAQEGHLEALYQHVAVHLPMATTV